MSYATPAEVRAVVLQSGGAEPSTDDMATPAIFDDAQLQVQIDQAQSIVDGYLASLYKVPFPDNDVPALVTTITTNFAAYYATLTLRKSKDIETKNEPVWLRYVESKELLQKLSDGSSPLPGGEDDLDDGAAVFNPYEGDLWTSRDFDLRKAVIRRGYEV